MNKHDIDLVLLRKMFEAGNMTDPDIAEIMGQSATKIRYERYKMGYGRPELIECSVCHKMKKPNCYDSKHPGPCLKCRNANGKETEGHGGRPKSQTKKKKYRCLRCPTVFTTPLDDKGVPIIHFCDKCQKQIPYWGEPEEFYAHGART